MRTICLPMLLPWNMSMKARIARCLCHRRVQAQYDGGRDAGNRGQAEPVIHVITRETPLGYRGHVRIRGAARRELVTARMRILPAWNGPRAIDVVMIAASV